MDRILVKPRNQEELNLLIALFKRMDIVFQVVSEDKGGKKKGKQA